MPYYQRKRSITAACPRTPYHSLTFQCDVLENPLESHPNVTCFLTALRSPRLSDCLLCPLCINSTYQTHFSFVPGYKIVFQLIPWFIKTSFKAIQRVFWVCNVCVQFPSIHSWRLQNEWKDSWREGKVLWSDERRHGSPTPNHPTAAPRRATCGKLCSRYMQRCI